MSNELNKEFAIFSRDADYSINPRSVLDLNPQQYEMLWNIAKVYASSVFSGSKNMGKAITPNDAFVALMLGIELGFKPITALQHVSIINGKPSLDGKGMLAVIHASGLLKSMDVDGDDKKCKVTMTRTNGISYSASFTIEQAKGAGLVKDGGAWTKYPEVMLKWRCVAFCARVLFPDIIGGVYTPEEIADNVHVDDDGTMTIDTSVKSPDQLREEMIAQLISEQHYPDRRAIIDMVKGYVEKDGDKYKRPITFDDYQALYHRLVSDVKGKESNE